MRYADAFEGVDLFGVIRALCTHFGIYKKGLVSISKRFQVAHAPVAMTHIAAQELSIVGSNVADG